jgi:hypothetical protein
MDTVSILIMTTTLTLHTPAPVITDSNIALADRHQTIAVTPYLIMWSFF